MDDSDYERSIYRDERRSLLPTMPPLTEEAARLNEQQRRRWRHRPSSPLLEVGLCIFASAVTAFFMSYLLRDIHH